METALLEQLERVAADTGSRFHEVVLDDTRANVLTRFAARASDSELAEHHRVAEHQLGGAAGLALVVERLERLVRDRPSAIVLPTVAGDVEGAYRDLLAVLG